MTSEPDSSSLVPLATISTSETHQSKRWSPVWKHCRTANTENDENPAFSYCTFCDPPP